ncbi:MAG: hypothetical protein JSR37_01830 [Verrucomicrobia bacterium]|nr:hypothetical protein [Verrucomicrobiota bacterium]MBS0635981.1 hypothetical protein [Verrucomicrobiota bacterium]
MSGAIHGSPQPDYSGIVEKSTQAAKNLPVKIERLSYQMSKAPFFTRIFHTLGVTQEARSLKAMQASVAKLPPSTDFEAVLKEAKSALDNIAKEQKTLDKSYMESYTPEETSRIIHLGDQARKLDQNIESLESLAKSKKNPELFDRLKEIRHDIKQLKAAANATVIGRIMLKLGIGSDAAKIQEQRVLKQQLYDQAIQQTGSHKAAKAESAHQLPESEDEYLI